MPKKREKKSLFCFCHFGGNIVVNEDKSVSYKGGSIDGIVINEETTYDAFISMICEQLSLTPSGKSFRYSVKFDKSCLLPLKDQNGLDKFLQFNDGSGCVYVSETREIALEPHVAGNTRSSDKESHSAANRHAEVVCADRDLVGCSNTLNDSSAEYDNGEDGEVECAGRENQDQALHEGCASSEKISTIYADYANEITKDQIFNSADDLRLALYKYSLAKRFKYKYSRNALDRIKVTCMADKCPWKLTARSVGDSGLYRVHAFVEEHDHEGLRDYYSEPFYKAKWLMKLAKEKVKGSPDCLSTKNCKDFLSHLTLEVNSRQTFRFKEQLKLAINGNKEDTFRLIPWMCQHLMSVMPGTIAAWSSTEENRFKQLFVVYHSSISGFQLGCRPLIFIDEFLLYGDCKGTLLSFTALDANDEVFPLAYGVEASSSGDVDWTWFIEKLKLVVGERQAVIISEGKQNMLDKLHKLFSLATHSHSYLHLQQNFGSYIGKLQMGSKSSSKKAAFALLKTIALARSDADYNNALMALHRVNKDIYDWVLASGPENWANSRFKGKRWDKLNSDETDPYNSWLLRECQKPLVEFMKVHLCKVADLFQNRRRDLMNWKGPVGDRIDLKIKDNMTKAQNLVVSRVYDFIFDFEYLQKSTVKVDLRGMNCSCLDWQMTGIPCVHACKAAQWANLDVNQFVEKWFHRDTQEIIYQKTMPDFSMLDIHASDDNLNPMYDVPFDLKAPAVKRAPGRPRLTQPNKRPAPSDSDAGNRRTITCLNCKGTGHNQRTCKKSKQSHEEEASEQKSW
ncbi:hypothetical protein L6164_001615 [Bauhinia variegata]|uniref:Uncharacterized protein n=1 Tax=Bauhinia variegata TaxID=167791 RepID=A0ACB9QA90_BAUVA|nr:hypothetical protein L6164_001615 [Bauhinia variegata]